MLFYPRQQAHGTENTPPGGEKQPYPHKQFAVVYRSPRPKDASHNKLVGPRKETHPWRNTTLQCSRRFPSQLVTFECGREQGASVPASGGGGRDDTARGFTGMVITKSPRLSRRAEHFESSSTAYGSSKSKYLLRESRITYASHAKRPGQPPKEKEESASSRDTSRRTQQFLCTKRVE